MVMYYLSFKKTLSVSDYNEIKKLKKKKYGIE